MPALIAIIVLGVIVVSIVGGVLVFAGVVSSQAGAVATPAASTGAEADKPDTASIEKLNSKLLSGDESAVAEALALEPEDIPPGVVEGFAGLEVEYRAGEAQPFDGGWAIPALVTQPDGSVTEWMVTVVEGDDGYVFLDSAPVEG